MNKSLSSLLAASVIILSGLHVNAQDTNILSNKVGGGLAFGSDLGTLGLNFRAEFPVSQKVEIAPSMHYFFGKGANVLEVNGNINYLFEGSYLRPYALGGVNLSYWRDSFGEAEHRTRGCLGLNLGGGVTADVGNFQLFTEAKFLIAGCNDFSLTAGILIPIYKGRKEG